MKKLVIDIINAKVCPYCGDKPKLVDSEVIYGTSYGMVYYCEPCNAYVGVHKHNNKPLGRLANKELREAKKQAHFYFDQIWKKGKQKGINNARHKLYIWLSKQLNIPLKYTHIGMFDIENCNNVINLCKPYCDNKIYNGKT